GCRSAGKIVFDYVIRRLNALSADLKNRLGGLTFAEAPLSAISRFNWSAESTKARRLVEEPREDGSSFRADLEQATPNKKTVYEIRYSHQANCRASPNPHLHRAPATNSPRPATAAAGCNLPTSSVPLHSCQATGSHHRTANLPPRRAMLWRLNGPCTKPKLPVLL